MDDPLLDARLAAARRAGIAWSASRRQASSWAVMARLEAPRWPRALAAVAASSAVVVVAGWGIYRGALAPAGPGMEGTAEAPLRVADGSSVVLDGASTVLRTAVETSNDVELELEAGGARFDVAKRPSRLFRVRAGDVTVQVIGTRFHVARQSAQTRVSVDRGRVLVTWPGGGSRELGVGEAGVFPPEAPVVAANPVRPEETGASARTSPGAAARAAGTRGHAGPALARASRADVQPAADGPGKLFARADAERAARRPEAAIVHLRELVRRFPDDAWAPAAAFTTGRLLLESLDRPGEAAAAFADARRLSRTGTLAEDALAREVEALARAGDAATARRRAELYRDLFPNGLRLRVVMRLGGLQAAP
jgi:transmembrane sensor